MSTALHLPKYSGEATARTASRRRHGRGSMRRFSWFNATSLTLGFAFLYLPMIILVIYSFNE